MSIDIAIIDSGINPSHPHVQGVAGAVTFDLDGKGRVIENDNYEDRIGHGTAIAGIFREAIPSANLWAIKIFRSDLSASSQLLLAGLAWAIEANMKVIHLSLGTEREQEVQSIRQLCRQAHQQGLVITAAARGCDDVIYPARIETVIGAYWNKTCRQGTIVYHPDTPIEFGAWGHPRPIPGLNQRHNFCGSSFAAAHVSARAAQLLKSDPKADSITVKKKLIRQCDNKIS